MSNVYEIGIKIGMQNAVSPVLAIIAKEVLGLDAKVAGLTKRFGALGTQAKLALGGGLGLAAGVATLGVYGKIVDKGNELVSVQRRMSQAGVAQKEIAEATAKAYEMTAQFKNTGVVENLKLINDARSTFGSQHDATHHVDEFIKAESFLKAYQGGKGQAGAHGLGQEIIAAMKSGEIAGKITPAEMKEHVAQLVGMRVAYGNNVKINDYLTAQRAGGVALRNSEDSFRYGIFPALVQENGVNAGTMMMTAFNKVVAGTGNRTQSLRAMESVGLLNESNVDYDKSGRVVRLKDPSGIKGSEDAARNFPRWVMETLKPLLDVKTGGDKVKEAQLISQLFPDRNAAKAVTEIIQQWPKLVKDAALQMQARNEYVKNGSQEGSLDYQKQAFDAQTKSFMETLGAPMVAQATEALKSINSALSSLVGWAKDANPETLKAIGNGLLVVGTAVAALGAAAVIGAMVAFAGPVGLVVAGIVTLGAAIAAFWPQISGAVAGVGEKLNGLVESVKGAFDGIINAIMSFASALAAIPGKIAGALSGLPGGPGFNPGRLGSDIGKMGADGMPKTPSGVPAIPGGSEGSRVLKSLGDKRSELSSVGKTASLRVDAPAFPKLAVEAPTFPKLAFSDGRPVKPDDKPLPQKLAMDMPQRSQTINLHSTTTLDGQVVARSTVAHIMRGTEHPVRAPAADSWARYQGGDAQFATG